MRSPWSERVRRPALAAGSGLLLAGSFPPVGLGWLAVAALLPLLVAIHPPGSPHSRVATPGQAWRVGYLAGVVFFLFLLHWIPRLPRENVTIPYAMVPALALMVAYLALYPAVTCLVTAWLARRGLPVGLVFPLVWTLLEALRGTGTFGFPWGSLAYATASFPHLIQFASFTGMWGVTLWLAAVNGLVHAYLSLGWGRGKITALAALFLALGAPYLHARNVLLGATPRAAVRVGVIQPNVGQNKWERAIRDSVVTGLIRDTEVLLQEWRRHPPDLVVWPETAVPARLPREPYYRRQVEALVDRTGVPLLAGFPDGEALREGGFRFANSAGLLSPGRGLVARYDKRHLVPFSEYMPLPVLNRYDFGQGSFTPGTDPGLFVQLEVPFGVLVCFESIFPGQARELAQLGARYLVNITNDQWFGDSPAPYQHFAMNALRCIENRMGMVRVANTGISGAIDPYGRVRARTGTFVKTAMVVPVELGSGPTFYARHGNWILWVSGVLLAILAAWGARRGR